MTSEMLRKIIEETLSRFGRDAEYDDYIAVARELFPKEIGQLARGFERQGFIKWLKDGMRQVANVGEDDPDAPVVQFDLIPGWPAPAYLNIGSDRGPKLIRFVDSTVPDLDLSIEKRSRKAAQINARVEDLKGKRAWLANHRARTDETVGQVCQRLAETSAPPPTSPDQPRDHL